MKTLPLCLASLLMMPSIFAATANGEIEAEIDSIHLGKATIRVSVSPETNIDKAILEEIGCFNLTISSFDIKERGQGPIYKVLDTCDLEGSLSSGWKLNDIAPLSGKTKEYGFSLSSTHEVHRFYEKRELKLNSEVIKPKLKGKRSEEASVSFQAENLGFVIDQHDRRNSGFGYAGHLLKISPKGSFVAEVESIVIEDAEYISISNFENNLLDDFRRRGQMARAGQSIDSDTELGLFIAQGLNVKHEYVYAPGIVAGFSQLFGGSGIIGERAVIIDDNVKNAPASLKLFIIYEDDTYSESDLNFSSSKLNNDEMRQLKRSLDRL